METAIHLLKHTIMITVFVFVMMLVIEYINVVTRGSWQEKLTKNQFGQYLFAALMGGLPGCLGAFMVVGMYSHRMVSLGALVAAMIATSGDETFVMFAMIPEKTFVLTAILIFTGIAVGALTDLLLKNYRTGSDESNHSLEIHDITQCNCFPKGKIIQQWVHCSPARGVLAAILSLIIIFLISGDIGPENWNWVKFTVLLTTGFSLFIVSTVPDHFLEEHLWNHIARKHVPQIFLWTLGAFIIMFFITGYLHLDGIIKENPWSIMMIAGLVGLVPESGPHLIFLTMYTKGLIPISILLVSSIVQDGHGMLPLLAFSRRDFLVVKFINLISGLLIGSALLLLGY